MCVYVPATRPASAKISYDIMNTLKPKKKKKLF